MTLLGIYARYNGGGNYTIYKPTHTLDAGEMARLIDGAIQECRQLNIPTMTPQEIED